MKAGDIVRFRGKYLPSVNGKNIPVYRSHEWHIGLLVEYYTWEKIATVMYAGELIRVHASDVTKAGKKDGLVAVGETNESQRG